MIKKLKLMLLQFIILNRLKKVLKLINKKTKVILSIFAGRAADAGKDPVTEFKKIISIARKYNKCRNIVGKC